MIIHVGDFAYNMATDNGRVGNEFMKQIEPIAAYVPYMTCVGNHEYYEDFNMSNYKAHFSMPEERFYSIRNLSEFTTFYESKRIYRDNCNVFSIFEF